MNLVLFFNRRSGRGAAARAAESIGRALRPRGHECALIEAVTGSPMDILAAPLTGAEALVVIGGDGTVLSASDAAIAGGKPLYHVPIGTENLFAREFGMDRRVATLIGALERRRVVSIDAPTCNEQGFLTMCSVGPDASVIRRLASTRSGRITHRSYLRPILDEWRSPRIPSVRVRVDGRPVVDGEPGWLVVANSRQYALRVDPAERADPSDGELDVRFFPARTVVDVLAWLVRSRLRRAGRDPRAVHARGRSVEVASMNGPLPFQTDGEAGAGETARLDIHVRPRRLGVLAPNGWPGVG